MQNSHSHLVLNCTAPPKPSLDLPYFKDNTHHHHPKRPLTTIDSKGPATEIALISGRKLSQMPDNSLHVPSSCVPCLPAYSGCPAPLKVHFFLLLWLCILNRDPFLNTVRWQGPPRGARSGATSRTGRAAGRGGAPGSLSSARSGTRPTAHNSSRMIQVF